MYVVCINRNLSVLPGFENIKDTRIFIYKTYPNAKINVDISK